jgi:hypothetical protein
MTRETTVPNVPIDIRGKRRCGVDEYQPKYDGSHKDKRKPDTQLPAKLWDKPNTSVDINAVHYCIEDEIDPDRAQ